jgi:enamine deaminase RidA (YjgF/YER057c/UK114 family)
MTELTNIASFDARLAALDIELPNVPTPIAKFVPYRRDGDLLILAGQICEWNGTVPYRGKIGQDHDLKAGQAAARICALNLIAALRQACGGTLAPVRQCLRLGGFVNCTPDFESVPFVINGASDLMHDVFGDVGIHARTAIGVAALPQCAAVEVDAMFAVA